MSRPIAPGHVATRVPLAADPLTVAKVTRGIDGVVPHGRRLTGRDLWRALQKATADRP